MSEIIEILKKWNPWEKEINIGIRRDYYIKKIYPLLERKEIIVLKGIRRSGKSTLMKQLFSELISKGVNKRQILYLNLEDYNLAGLLNISLFEDVLKEYKEYSKNKKTVYFFIDEIQKVPSWEKWIRTKYDLEEGIKFIISGSSASLLSKELSTLLTGRNLSFIIRPLSFSECCNFVKDMGLNSYLEYGGFPEVVLEKSKDKKVELLQQYFEDIIHKDIIDRHSIRNTKQVFELARYIISSSGSKVSINKLSKMFGMAKDTLQVYINYMLDAFLLYEVPFFSYSLKVRHEVSKLPKIYCSDLGLINAISQRFSKNTCLLFENAVLIRLVMDYNEISYWGDLGSEVDFIAGNIAVNVTSSEDIPEREFKGLEGFGKTHRGFKAIIVAVSSRHENIISIHDFLTNEEDKII